MQSPPRGSTAVTETVLVVGATSGIGEALCRQLSGDGSHLVLAGRDVARLREISSDLRRQYGAEVAWEPFNALSQDDPRAFLDRCFARAGGRIDGIIVCYGYLPVPSEARTNPLTVRQTIDVNFTSVASLLTAVAERLEEGKGAWIAAISSVAGDRGRQSNYVYGGAKGGLSIFLQGLRNRLHSRGVHVLTIKPGFVDTRMLEGTAGSDSRLKAPPERVAGDIVDAIRKRRDVLYTPWYWRPILFLLRSIPEWIFKRLKT